MKKFLLLTLLLLTSTFTMVRAEETQIFYDFESVNGYGYNLATGNYESKDYWSSTDKMLINPETTDSELLFTITNFHHVLFWNDNNHYIGYINTSNTDIELSTFLGYSATTTTDIPEGAYMFALQNYDYGGISDTIVYDRDLLDVIAWGGLSYIEIFENDNNHISNGDFKDGTTGWGFTGGPTYSVVNEKLYIDVSTSVYTFRETDSLDINDVVYLAIDIEANSSDVRVNIVSTIPDTSLYHSGGGTVERISTIYSYDEEASLDIRIRGIDAILHSIVIDNLAVYNLSDIFNDTNLPSLSEFDILYNYYMTYKNHNSNITYDDIFSNNHISNGDFKDGTTGWGFTGGPTYSVVNEKLYIDVSTSVYTFRETDSLNVNDVVYYGVDILSNSDTIRLNLVSTNPDTSLYHSGGGNVERISIITTYDEVSSLDIRVRGNTATLYSIIIDNLVAFNLSDIFTLQLSITDFESLIDSLEFPTNSYYVNDYDDSHLDLIGVSYYYDQITHEYDAETGVNTYLTNLGINDDISKVILGIAGMIILAIVLGFATKNIPIVIMVEIVAYLTFSILGWFPMWIVILLAIILAVMGILKISMKGGNSND